ncbi:unnamed protein product [Orchesella dallaii]|uniref:Uncharacterized protein n=1 Tax=Orchesella dallaii TaxID=48710 RepID=A0ABP1RRW6_9HEXA
MDYELEASSMQLNTSYFLQRSSFSVQNSGNDSAMFGSCESLASIPDSDLNAHAQWRKPIDSSSHFTSFSSSVESGAVFIGEDKKPTLSRNNSLVKFFLGPQSNGMKSNEIVEYVIGYCEQRVTSPLSDMPDLEYSPPNFNITAVGSMGRDSQLHFEKEVKTVPQSIGLNVSSGDGYNKFKKNLHHRRKIETRYRGKLQHHVEFEKKRLDVDKHYSQRGSSQKTLKGQDLMGTLERPSKNMCNSPPSKLLPSSLKRRMSSKYLTRGRGDSLRRTNLFDIQEENENAEKQQETTISKSSRNYQQASCSDLEEMGTLDDPSKSSTKSSNRIRHENYAASGLPISNKMPISISMDLSQILKHYNHLPEGDSIIPVGHSELQQSSTGHQSCPHHCAHQPSLHGIPGPTPIVIHIHLPSSQSASTSIQPVATAVPPRKKWDNDSINTDTYYC